MKRTKKTFYRKKTASLPKKEKKPVKNYDRFFEEYIEPALSPANLKKQAVSFLILFLAVLLIFSIIQGGLMYLNYASLKEEHEKTLNDLAYWERILVQHPNSPDVYYNAAIYAGKLGERDKAIKYLRMATVLDPEFREARILEEIIKTR